MEISKKIRIVRIDHKGFVKYAPYDLSYNKME